MSSDPADFQNSETDAASLLGSTPVMGETVTKRAFELSMAHVQPPLRVPGYEQEKFLGRGAFGEVWKAIDSNSGRAVAIKFYNRRGGLDWSHMSREVEKLQYLFSDRHVVQLFDVGWEASPPYYVMEYMQYGSLEDRLKKEAISVSQAVAMTRNIALGLVSAHDRGILHCDLKPDNIMLDEDGKPRLADFGQSRLKHEHAPAVGTLFYMAPEQAELSMAPDARWDVYALGAILYRMVTGKLPYLTQQSVDSVSSEGSVENRLRAYSKILQTSKPPTEHYHVAGVDSSLRRIIDGCLAINPKHRYPNVQSVLHALALRESKRAQAPLLMLGILGPAIVVLVLSLVSVWMFNRTLQTARTYLLERTSESDQFAAKSVAARFAMDIDRRWRILEQEAARGPLPEGLQRDSGPFVKAEANDQIASWLKERYTYWNTQFSDQTTASYWYVLDRNGLARAIAPSGEELIGSYFGYREYFHGQGQQLDEHGPAPPPIGVPHRSNVFRSKPLNRPAVSLSVPILDPDDQQVLGVLVMEAELGHFADFQATRNQSAVLVDLRPDESGRRGLIVEHPRFSEQLQANETVGEFYVSRSTLAAMDAAVRERRGAGPTSHSRSQRDSSAGAGSQSQLLDPYLDPVAGGASEDLMAVIEPVFFRRAANQVRDSGWVLLVQESRSETLQPITNLSAMVIYGGLSALVLVVLIMAGLWWLVVLVQNAPNRLRAWQLWGGHLTGASTTTPNSLLAATETVVSGSGRRPGDGEHSEGSSS